MLRDPDSEPPWVPRADVFMSSAGEFTVKVELAALRREDVELSIEGRGIRITGHRPDADRAANGSRYVVNGISWGWFDMVVEVPAGFDLSRATAQYQNGLLRVLVPQPEPCK
jgi:HSP20 family molecular chaperone IbpA